MNKKNWTLLNRAIALLLTLVSLSSLMVVTASAAYENTYTNTGNQREDIVRVAATQVGNTNGRKYRSDGAAWCAAFIVWCARQAGIDNSIIRNTGWATADDLGVTYRGRPADRSSGIDYTPQRGDIIIFDWSSNGYTYKSPASNYGDHVGIVEKVENGYVYTIEGNSSGAVRRRSYPLSSGNIKGYGVPNYKNTVDQKYWLDLNSMIGNTVHYDSSPALASAVVIINGSLYANDVSDFYQQFPAGTSFEIRDIKAKNGYTLIGQATYSGTLWSDINVNIPFSKAASGFSCNFRMKSGAYTNAYTGVNGSYCGRVYSGDVVTVKEVFSNGWMCISCPWDGWSGGYRTVYVKISEFKFMATKYIDAFSSAGGSKVGRVYRQDLCPLSEITSNGWVKCQCPWTGGVMKTIWVKSAEIYG